MAVTRDELKTRIGQALGETKADLVIKNTRFLNVVTGETAAGDIALCGDRIVGTYESYDGTEEIDGSGLTVVPGFIDTHVHCESTCVTPMEFDRCVLPRGTTTAICDPHEICNVLGDKGLRYFLDCAEGTALDLRVQLSSCVPATELETSGARLEAADLLRHKDHPKVLGLAEFMNFPGVFHKVDGVLEKLAAFDGRHIDGHAPLLSGRELNAYLSCGIRNCHETTSAPEAMEKLRKGMQVLIRDGSVSKDVHALAPVIQPETSPFLGFCTDDRNPLDIAEEGHMDHLIRSAIRLGAPLSHVYRAATWSAARGFGLFDRGLIAPGQRADLVLLDDLEDCAVNRVIRNGRVVSPETFAGRPAVSPVGLRSVKLHPVTAEDFAVPARGSVQSVIGVLPGKIITAHLRLEVPAKDGKLVADPDRDILKICVFARHGTNQNVGRGFASGFHFREGALASSVGHDSHNICVVGASDEDMAIAVNRLIELQGGFVAVRNGKVVGELALPLAGLMSLEPFETVERHLRSLRASVKEMGCPLAEPFLQLAFLPLPVIPHLKITDRGLVDVDKFAMVEA
ncbi:adenine deaminase [Azospirillum brasilense]|uniref:Adenine deaminase n=1 Tax=Azospirillum brasilense TaxID=192 RepID=A0A0P0F3K4_AZOBR|nr:MULTISPECIES: adenine deaminase [Azospirillum]ALJ37578.1 adenosine deaminase [Azospirillum brasilense]MDW7553781.1 adenine deaminase [Azospirillum brasilense]MDW7592780.1 adenine deaminase [Azospirillum brasilense]MDW7628311.1 adenine deaminase [Azospirillum brasilense]MDX5952250.1 adenine deaminase [Azospirillum brasilense]